MRATARRIPARRWAGGKQQRREFLWALLFISPWLVGFLVLTVGAMVVSLYYSFTDYSIAKPPQWVGLANYRQLISSDPHLAQAISNTLFMVVFGIPLHQVVAFMAAVVLNIRVRGMPFYRTLYFLPAIMPVVPVTIVWTWMFNPQLGPVNILLAHLGFTPPLWLNDPGWSKPTLILLNAWQAGTTMAIYLAALQGVPEELYEAAMIDGGGRWAKLRHITIPVIAPVIAFNAILGIIYSFQYFTQAFVAESSSSPNPTIGGPENSLLFYAVYLYQNAFVYLKMGYASAMAWVLFVIVMAATLLSLYGPSRWVYYEGSER